MKYTKDQAEKILNYIDKMLSTNELAFIITSRKDNAFRVSDYIGNTDGRYSTNYDAVYDPNRHDNPNKNNFIDFNTITDLKDFISKYFIDEAEFFNTFLNKTDQNLREKMSYASQDMYGYNTFNYSSSNTAPCFYCTLIVKDKHIRTAFNKCDYLVDYQDAPQIMFMQFGLKDCLQVNRGESFMFDNTLFKLMAEYAFSPIATAATFEKFEQHFADVDKYFDFMIDFFADQHTLKEGKNGRFTQEIYNLIDKIQDAIKSPKTMLAKDKIKLEYSLEDNTSSFAYKYGWKHADKAQYQNMAQDLRCSNNIEDVNAYYTVEVTVPFVAELSMQVKNTVKHKLHTFALNNGLEFIDCINLGDNLKTTYPAKWIKFHLNCNDYSAIGVNPIKFFIPKMGMKSKMIEVTAEQPVKKFSMAEIMKKKAAQIE